MALGVTTNRQSVSQSCDRQQEIPAQIATLRRPTACHAAAWWPRLMKKELKARLRDWTAARASVQQICRLQGSLCNSLVAVAHEQELNSKTREHQEHACSTSADCEAQHAMTLCQRHISRSSACDQRLQATDMSRHVMCLTHTTHCSGVQPHAKAHTIAFFQPPPTRPGNPRLYCCHAT